ncbi:hypothetical protein QVD17_28640 [Tagetes erecta]|uniref:PARP-type domain-containing protein n=1 Tax=Tagetes erecta TaxID=13708 RepID=A0AAD8KAX7_TARER|nr:hypothetical protein QVD17_28640 [Tagetes erecta]
MATPPKPWKAEYAKSSRSSCITCKIPIDKEKLRLGKMVQSNNSMVSCLQFTHLLTLLALIFVTQFSCDDVEGIETLRWEDQEKIRHYVESGGSGSSSAPDPIRPLERQDEARTTAMKFVGLDVLGNHAVQYRELQSHESKRFHIIFFHQHYNHANLRLMNMTHLT